MAICRDKGTRINHNKLIFSFFYENTFRRQRGSDRCGISILLSSRHGAGAIRDIVPDEQCKGRENWVDTFIRHLLNAALMFRQRWR
jgi:hypothetical protein